MKKIISILFLLLALGGGLWAYKGSPSQTQNIKLDKNRFAKVTQGPFVVTIVASGTIANTQTHQLMVPRCSWWGGLELTFAIPEGSEVTPDTICLRFDHPRLRQYVEEWKDQIKNSEDRLQQLKEGKIKAEEDFAKRTFTYKTELRKAWDGYDTFLSTTVKNKIKQFDDKMIKLQADLESKEKEVIKAKQDHATADFASDTERRESNKRITGLEQEVRDLNHQMTQQAKAKRNYRKYNLPKLEVQKLQVIKVATEKIKNLDEEKEKRFKQLEARIKNQEEDIKETNHWMGRYQEELNNFEVKAGVKGTITYGNPKNVQDKTKVEVGKKYYPNRVLITIPAPSDMFANLKIHEELRPAYDIGTEVIGTFDAIPGLAIKGHVEKIGNLAKPKFPDDPASPKIFFVRTFFSQDQEGFEKVIAGMTLKAELFCKKLENVLSVPMEAVFEENGKTFVRTKKGNGYETLPVEIGDFNDERVVITKGLTQNQEVLLYDPTLEVQP